MNALLRLLGAAVLGLASAGCGPGAPPTLERGPAAAPAAVPAADPSRTSERLTASFLPMAVAGAVGGAVRWWDVDNPQGVPVRCAILANRPRPFLDGRAGTAALWFRHDAPGCFWEALLTARGDGDGVVRPATQGFSLSLTPSDASGWNDPDPAHFQRGWILAEFTGADGRNLAIKGPQMRPGQWTHVALTWQPGRLELWVDGQLAGERHDGVSLPDLDALDRLVVGANQHQWCSFGGALDEVAVWSRALAAGEVAALAARQPIRDEPALTCLVACDDALLAQVRRRTPRHPAADRPAIHLPLDGQGYFPPGPVPLTVMLPPGPGGACTISAAIAPAEAGAPVLATRRATLSPRPTAPAEVVLDLDPGRRGAFVAAVEMRDAGGQVLHTATVPFATIVALPPANRLPASSPLGDHYLRSDPGGLRKMGWWRGLGGKWTRLLVTQLAWPELEPARGQRYWDLLDREVDALLADGRCILFNLGGTPAWASAAPPLAEVEAGLLRHGSTPAQARRNAPGHRTSWPPARLQDWEDFATALATRYRGRIAAYECLNEPNAPEFSGTAADYQAMLTALHRAVRAADPAALVVGGVGCPGYVDWTRRIAKEGAAAAMEVLSVHDYHYDSPLRWAEAGRIPAAAAAIGGGLPVWDSESGYPMPPRDAAGRAIGRDVFVARYGSELWRVAAVVGVWESRAARWEVQATLAKLAAGAVRVIMHDTGGMQGLPYNQPPVEKGVAYAQLAAVVSTARRLTPLDPGCTGAAGALIEDLDGSFSAAFWSDAPRSLTLAWSGAPPAAADLAGNPVAVQVAEGRLVLPLHDGVLWVRPWPQPVAPARILALQGASDLQPGEPRRLLATLTNPGTAPVTWQLRVLAPAALAVEAPATVTVPAAGRAEAVISLGAGPDLARGLVPVTVEARLAGEVLGEAGHGLLWTGVDVPLPRLRQQPIAGAPWPEVPATRIAEEARLGDTGRANPMFPEGSPHWRGAADCSFTVQAGWTPAGIHLRVQVVDDAVVPPPPGREGQAFNWDAVEVFLDLRPAAARRARPASREAGTGQVFICAPAGAAWESSRTHLAGAPVTAAFSGRRLPGGWEVEGLLAPTAGALAAGRQLGLDVAVDDADDVAATPSRISQLLWHGASGNHADPSRWGWFTLAEVAP